jgi:hypothetical protein
MRARLLPLALLIIQPFVFYSHVLVNPEFHIPWDIFGFHAPLFTFQARELREGHLPLWNPIVYCGYPTYADIQAQTFYPPAWGVWLARNLSTRPNEAYLLEWFNTLHMMLAGLLMYGLLRRMNCSRAAALFGGTAYQLSAFFASQAQHVGAICGAAWLPLCWLGVYELRQRWNVRWFAVLVLALSMALLSGFTAVTYAVYTATVLFAAGFWIIGEANRWCLPRLLGAFAVTAGLLAIQLLPAVELADLSFAKLRANWYNGGGLPPNTWKALFWPNFFNVFEPDKFTEPFNFTFMYLYSGALPLLLAAAAIFWRGRRTRMLGALTAVLFLLCFGNHLPGFTPAFEMLPRSFRGGWYAEFFVSVFCGGLAVAAALMLQRLPGARWKWVAAVALGVELLAAGSRRAMNTAAGNWKWQSSETSIDGVSGIVDHLQDELHRQRPPLRIDNLDLLFHFSMSAPLRDFPTPGGDNPFAPLRVLELRREFTRGNYWERNLVVDRPDSPWLDFLNVGLLAAQLEGLPENQLELAGWCRSPADYFIRFYRNDNPQPRFFLAGDIRWAQNTEASRQLLTGLVREPGGLRRAAVVESPPFPVSSSGEVEVVSYRSNRIELQTRASGPSYLVTSETDYPGWQATLDGHPVPILTTNYAFRGLAVPEGNHRITMEFRPIKLFHGAAISTAVLLGLIGAVIFSRGASHPSSVGRAADS